MNLRKILYTLFAIEAAGCANANENFPVETFTTDSGKEVNITLIRHASLAIDYNGYVIYVDPVRNPGDITVDYTTMPKADFILITHEHGDHLDAEAINTLSKPDTKLLLNKTSQEKIGKGDFIGNNESYTLPNGMIIESVAAYNTTPGREKFHPKGNGNGYILNIDGLRIYLAGDTEDIPEMKEINDIDVAFLPVNQPYTMTVDQAFIAARMVSPKVLIPYHFGNTPRVELKEKLDNEGSGMDVRIRPMQ